MRSLILISSLLLSFVSSDDRARPRKPDQCIDAESCAQYNMDLHSAKCFGYKACIESTIDLEKVFCTGDKACLDAELINATGKVFCNGFESCKGAKRVSSSTEDVVCNGDHACNSVNELTAARAVICQGDSTCQTDTITAGDSIVCSGFKACKGADIESQKQVYCDGDTACYKTTVQAQNMRCYGKRVCFGSDIKIDGILNVYGWFGAVKCTISAAQINAQGFNALAGSVIDTQGYPSFLLKAYGYRSAVGSTTICRSGSDCVIQCKGIACKKALFLCEPGAKCNVEPEACQSDNSVKKHDGIFCPEWHEGVKPPMIVEFVAQQQAASYENDPDLIPVLEDLGDSDDESFEQLMEIANSYQDYIDDDDYMVDESLLYGGIEYAIYETSVYSNLFAAAVASILTFFIVFCYFKRKYKDSMYKTVDDY